MNIYRCTRSLLVAAALSLLGACASQPGLTSNEIDESGESSGMKMLKLSRDSEIDYMDLDFSRIKEE
jgi:hypothetical protein